ncbi:hypothetical protein ABZW10_33050 [Kitasatospora sp. NPDC004723]|uniref:hypothetical protein n=1 Tax=Kitasatospora sp. NPDC004723 TaxID=3154288 RepID=UPI0033A14E83
MAAATPTNTIAEVLRDLGLRQRARQGERDFTVESTTEGDRRTETYAVPLTAHAEQVLREHADTIRDRTAATDYPFTVETDAEGKPRAICRVPVERPRLSPRVAPKRYPAATSTAPTETEEPASDAKGPRTISMTGTVWAATKANAKADRVSPSHVIEQLLGAYNRGELRLDGDGMLEPPLPTAEQLRAVLAQALRTTDPGTDPDATAAALAEALLAAGHARTEDGTE